MVIGRLWLTSDLEVLKCHGSLSRLGADALSDHEMQGVRAKQGYRGKFANINISGQIFFSFQVTFYSWDLTVGETRGPDLPLLRTAEGHSSQWQRWGFTPQKSVIFKTMGSWFQTNASFSFLTGDILSTAASRLPAVASFLPISKFHVLVENAVSGILFNTHTYIGPCVWSMIKNNAR